MKCERNHELSEINLVRSEMYKVDQESSPQPDFFRTSPIYRTIKLERKLVKASKCEKNHRVILFNAA
jgi:hypothetical protein